MSLLLLSSTSVVQAELLVIVSDRSAVSTLSGDEVTQLFLGKRKSFPQGGRPVLSFHQGDRSSFNRRVLGKTDSQVKAAWSRLLFSGRAKAPTEYRSVESLIAAVAGDPDALAYLDTDSVPPGVRVVFRETAR